MVKLILLFILSFLLIACTNNNDSVSGQTGLQELRKGFVSPPMDARPKALWDWVDGNFSFDEITREMEISKKWEWEVLISGMYEK